VTKLTGTLLILATLVFAAGAAHAQTVDERLAQADSLLTQASEVIAVLEVANPLIVSAKGVAASTIPELSSFPAFWVPRSVVLMDAALVETDATVRLRLVTDARALIIASRITLQH